MFSPEKAGYLCLLVRPEDNMDSKYEKEVFIDWQVNVQRCGGGEEKGVLVIGCRRSRIFCGRLGRYQAMVMRSLQRKGDDRANIKANERVN